MVGNYVESQKKTKKTTTKQKSQYKKLLRFDVNKIHYYAY